MHTLSTVKYMYLDCPYMDIVGTWSVNTIKIQSHIFNVRNIIDKYMYVNLHVVSILQSLILHRFDMIGKVVYNAGCKQNIACCELWCLNGQMRMKYKNLKRRTSDLGTWSTNRAICDEYRPCVFVKSFIIIHSIQTVCLCSTIHLLHDMFSRELSVSIVT